MVLAGVIPVDHEIFAFFVANRDVCFYFFFGKKKKNVTVGDIFLVRF